MFQKYYFHCKLLSLLYVIITIITSAPLYSLLKSPSFVVFVLHFLLSYYFVWIIPNRFVTVVVYHSLDISTSSFQFALLFWQSINQKNLLFAKIKVRICQKKKKKKKQHEKRSNSEQNMECLFNDSVYNFCILSLLRN